ncbi:MULTISPECIES: hypothetical protein [unclassified Rhizobium]|uniref:hypothetical protein n=1 Tax=unclassified Rhizobium TaxID=2613769 RepID=UPI0016180E3A|nr:MULTISPECIES: hypothetical protein [unclassified Rhizobium]MBB3385990.1 hypothetical protein [Rhizobium sp. BK098]MBB3617832.1 hypothetical protein [Rhizobium sp. BK609]MBB3683352.1 hypothetical protein [Rhizobium sp. BK612]
MKFFLENLLRNADGAGGGGGGGDGAAAAAAAGAGGASAAVDPPANAANPDGAAAAADNPGAAAAASPAAAAAELYKPQGLADHLVGKTNNETMDNMAKALDGYRARDAQNKVPDKVEAYSEFTNLPDTIKTQMETLKGDKLFERVSAKALELKMPVPAFQALTTEMMSAAAEIGLLEPPIDFEAEKTALIPDNAKHLPPAEQTAARERRMNENFAYIDAMVARGADKGGLSKEAADYAKAMLGDTARGHQFLEWIRSSIATNGATPFMGGGAAAGGDPRAALREKLALPEHQVGNAKFNRASYEALQKEYQALLGNS